MATDSNRAGGPVDGDPRRPQSPRGSARRGRMIAAGVSIGAAVALTTVIAVTNGSAASTSAGDTSGTTGGSGSTGVNPRGSTNNDDGFGATPPQRGDERTDPFGDYGSSGPTYTPHTRSGGS